MQTSKRASLITHAGISITLLGALASAVIGFTGDETVRVGSSLVFDGARRKPIQLGELPNWTLRVENSWREDHQGGQPKQWYTRASVIDSGTVIHRQDISVNNPLSFRGVDVYQSGWGPHTVQVAFNEQTLDVNLRPMGQTHVGAIGITPEVALILTIRNQDSPLKVYVKTKASSEPQFLQDLKRGQDLKLGTVEMTYRDFIASTVLNYKCDPGLPVVYVGFVLIIAGVTLNAIPEKKKAEAPLA